MTVPEDLKRELLKEFDKHLQKARRCPMTPGSLEEILTRAAGDMARRSEELLAQAASDEADFPPSNVPALRGDAAVQPTEEGQKSVDDQR